MSDIFISYASEDREPAKALAQTLEAEGWSVWWDRLIPFGRPFDDVIQENIDAAKCVLVLWTASSVASKWVRSEASEAEERNVLIPVLLDRDVDIPLAFKLLQAANLADWQPGSPHGEYTKLVDQIRALVAGPADRAGVDARAPRSPTPGRARERWTAKRSSATLRFVVVPSALAVGTALLLTSWRTPTHVELALQADRLAFTIGGVAPVAILDRATTFESLTIESISRVAFSGTGLRQIAPDGDFPVERGAVVLEGRPEDRSSVTIEGDGDGAAAGRLEAIAADPAAMVVLEVRSGGSAPRVLVRVDGQELAPGILPLGAFRLTASQAKIVSPVHGVPGFSAVTIRAGTSEADPIIRVNGGPSSFAAVITPPARRAVELLGSTGAAITSLDLTRQTGTGGYESALLGKATLTFPGYSKEPVVLDGRALIEIDDIENASLSPTRVVSTQPGMEVTFTGEVGKLRSRLGSGPPTDHRLTLFDKLWHGSRPAILFSILAWAAAVSIGAYKLYKEARP
jgi:TIR domain